ncbi:hypothetical protein [Pseudochrobactrum asaccharolyticum]|uniref:Uncharacterized protein n=1 Tax=Pseudochrobactrum asaccharolyticum TaxID=354351 RepID=A0A366DMI7_9HYPH|nr:hypothetical protein [Pseudochrobactrum asaccharolyticum]RBO90448.1 hypothetical protein DFR47_1139 [Pseudochrobactrum asaccharolyticum]
MRKFRVHTAVDGTLDVTAETPNEAQKIAKDMIPDAIITKIKVVKGE